MYFTGIGCPSENAVLVPEGYIVTSTALENFLDSTGVGERIKRLLTAEGVDRKGLEILAREAVETVMGYLKEKLPAPIAAQIDSILESPDIAKKAGDVLGGLGGILGNG